MPLDKKGYGHVMIDRWSTTAHRAAYAMIHGKPADDLVVMHSCDNRRCCNPNHLSLGTQAENLADMRAKGRAGDCRNFGERNGRTKIKPPEIREIFNLRAAGLSQEAIAVQIGTVGQSQVGRILRTKTPEAA